MSDEAVLGLGRAARAALVREQVPLAVDDEAAANTPNRLHDMHVLADDRVHDATLEEVFGEVSLLGVRLVDVLVPGVEVGDDEAGAAFPRPASVRDDLRRRDEVDGPRVGPRDAVRAVRVGEERDAQAADVHDQ
jgi:hypothetical protein